MGTYQWCNGAGVEASVLKDSVEGDLRWRVHGVMAGQGTHLLERRRVP